MRRGQSSASAVRVGVVSDYSTVGVLVLLVITPTSSCTTVLLLVQVLLQGLLQTCLVQVLYCRIGVGLGCNNGSDTHHGTTGSTTYCTWNLEVHTPTTVPCTQVFTPRYRLSHTVS